MTPPAADGGLPGLLPQGVHGIILGLKRRISEERDADFAKATLTRVEWLCAQLTKACELHTETLECLIAAEAKLDDANSERSRLVDESLRNFNAAAAFQRLLATATERLASAEVVIAPFAERADRYEPDEGDGDDNAWDSQFRIKHLRAARAWLTSKDGEKQP